MPKTNKTARETRPYLSAQEVMALSGTTENTLRGYVRRGVVEPHDTTAAGYQRWSSDQATELSLIAHMREHGATTDDVAEAAAAGSLDDAAYGLSMRSIRENRRALKAIVHLRAAKARIAAVGERDGFYLRYLPQRWCALLPAAEGCSQLLGLDEYVAGRAALDAIVQVVGWSPTFSAGTLTSVETDLSAGTAYVFAELASPPMPNVTGMPIVDGGCYEAVCEGTCPGCDTSGCASCVRYGRRPTPLERASWRAAAEQGRVIDRTVTPERLEGPYPTGFWADASRPDERGKFHVEPPAQGRGSGKGGNRIITTPTVVPRLMPQNEALPLSATACVLPAGFYLCRQSDYAERDQALSRMLGATAPMPRFEMSAEAEVAASRALQKRVARARGDADGGVEPGPYIEPFAAPRGFDGDPAFDGFVRDLDPRDLHRLTLPVNAALAPERGFVIAHSSTPGPAPDDSLRQELQILVHPEEALIER